MRHKRLEWGGLIAAAALLSGCATQFDLQGHRGARGLVPENTLTAFSKALDIGVSLAAERECYKPGRVIDLSEGAAKTLKMTDVGLTNVRLEVMN